MLVPNTSLSAIVLEPSLTGPAAQAHAFFRNGDPSNVREYAEHYMRWDPHPQYLASVPGRFVSHSRLVSPSRWGKDPFTGEFLTRHRLRYILAAELPLPDGQFLSFALHREPGLGDFTPRECQALDLVSRDISRAVYGAIVRERVEELTAGQDSSRGFLVFDHAGELLRGNLAGERLAAKLAAEGGLPSDALIALAQRLSESGSREGDSTERSFLLESGGRLHVRLMALTSGAWPPILCLFDEPPIDPFERVADAVRLTPREREVAALTIQGLGNRHIAHILRCSEITIATHLRNIYRKANVNGRIELTRLMSTPGRNETN